MDLHNFGKPLTLLCVGLLMSIVAAACSPSAPTAESEPTSAAPNAASGSDAASEPSGSEPEGSILTYSGEDRQERLLDGAAEEGELTWYTSLAGDIVTAMEQGFEAEYPDIDLQVFRASSDDIVTRLTQEAAAGQVRSDVFELSSDSARLLIEQEGIAGDMFYSPEALNVSDRFRVGEGDLTSMAADRISYISFGYGKDAIPTEEVPSTLQDLINPALAGELAITASGTGVRWVGSVLHAMGDEEGEAFLRQLAEQGVQVHGISGSALMELIGQGAAAASPAVFRNHARQLIDDGAPVDWTPVEPVTGNVGYAFLNGETASPHAALLFMDFLLGDGGQQVFSDNLYDSPSGEVDFEVWIPDETFETTEEYGEAFVGWQTLFDKIFG